MPSTDLMELASRVEAGEGPDREAFEEAYTAIHGMSWQAAAYHHGSLGGEPDRAKQEAAFRFGELVRVRAWLDAAATLVPPGDDATGELYRLEAYSTNGVLVPTHVRASAWVPGAPRAYAATPAMALTAACLRARAHQGTAHAEQ